MSNSVENIKADFVRISSGFNTEITGKLFLNKINVNNVAETAAVVVAAGKHTTTGGTTITIPANNVLATDLVFASIQSSSIDAVIRKVTPSPNQIVVACDVDPGNAVIAWQALRSTH
jgi:hypothetical protein